MMPNVKGLQQAAATQKLARSGFNNVAVQSDPQSTAPQGQVVNQTPSPGQNYAPSTQVTLYVSGGGVQVPPVTNLPVDSARSELQSYGFQVNIDDTAGPAGTQPGIVWNQNPAQGTTEPKNFTVTIFVQPQATASPSPSASARRRLLD